ncbi:hypothetical protein FS749_008123 [Ceratobasidium sp. UAMH 11750]|nr:hypothetical protein FS749_008123 [Ceratobasidium sp. UAMH 11750]
MCGVRMPGKDICSGRIYLDHVPPPADQAVQIERALGRQRGSPVPKDAHEKYNNNPASFWDRFYKWNEGNFFRDRKWLHQEFPELTGLTRSDAGKATVVEVGCGAGNTVFPLLESNQNPELTIIGCDYSSKAIDVVKAHPLYSAPHIGSVSACVWDLSGPNLPLGVDSGTVDIVVMVFVLSALHPNEWASAISNVYSMLKPGGLVVLRDYGRYDLTQLRFKEGRLLDDNFYVRGDGTRVYFFDLDELAWLFTRAKAPTKDGPEAAVVTSSVKVDASSLDPEGTNGMAASSVELDPAVGIANAGNLPALSRDLSGPGTPHNEAAISLKELEIALDQVSVAEVHTQPPAPEGNVPTETRAPLDPQISAPLPEDERPPRGEAPPSITDLSRAQASAVETNKSLGVAHPLFTISGMGVDRRLLVNRKRQLQMYRVWMQAKFRKI